MTHVETLSVAVMLLCQLFSSKNDLTWKYLQQPFLPGFFTTHFLRLIFYYGNKPNIFILFSTKLTFLSALPPTLESK